MIMGSFVVQAKRVTGSKADNSTKVRMMKTKDGEGKAVKNIRLWGIMPLINDSHLTSQPLVDGKLLRLIA
jgi:hypothetical protein